MRSDTFYIIKFSNIWTYGHDSDILCNHDYSHYTDNDHFKITVNYEQISVDIPHGIWFTEYSECEYSECECYGISDRSKITVSDMSSQYLAEQPYQLIFLRSCQHSLFTNVDFHKWFTATSRINQTHTSANDNKIFHRCYLLNWKMILAVFNF